MKLTLALLFSISCASCTSPYSSHMDKVRYALDKVNYKDGISKTEAKAIADAYLIRYGAYKGRASYAKVSEGDGEWLGKVIVVKSLATPVDADLPPVIVDKNSGAVRWQHGPSVTRISLDDIDSDIDRAS